MKNFTPELIAKAKTAESAEKLLEIAKENGVELTAEEAKTYFAQLNANGAVSDDELDVVAGGFLGISCPGDEEADADNLMALAGKRVRVLSGKKCTKCHSNEGIVGHNALAGSTSGSSIYVFCPKCNMVIMNHVSSDDIEVIG